MTKRFEKFQESSYNGNPIGNVMFLPCYIKNHSTLFNIQTTNLWNLNTWNLKMREQKCTKQKNLEKNTAIFLTKHLSCKRIRIPSGESK